MAALDAGMLTEMLQCGICKNTLSNPKSLRCSHSYCKMCLEDVVEFIEGGSGVIKCPTQGCEKSTFLSTDQTVDDLHVDHIVKGIVNMMKKPPEEKEPEGEKKMTCNLCRKNDIYKYCIRCKEYKCESCKDEHDDISDAFVSVRFEQNKLKVLCKEHACEAKYTCTCNNEEFICVYCAHRGHKGHTFETFVDGGKTLKGMLANKITFSDDLDKQWTEAQDDMSTARSYLHELLLINKINCINEYVDFVNKEEEKLKHDFDLLTAFHTKSFSSTVDSIEYFKECLTRETMDILLERSEIINKLNTSMGKSRKIPEVNVSLTNPNFRDENPLGTMSIRIYGKRFFMGKSRKTFKSDMPEPTVRDPSLQTLESLLKEVLYLPPDFKIDDPSSIIPKPVNATNSINVNGDDKLTESLVNSASTDEVNAKETVNDDAGETAENEKVTAESDTTNNKSEDIVKPVESETNQEQQEVAKKKAGRKKLVAKKKGAKEVELTADDEVSDKNVAEENNELQVNNKKEELEAKGKDTNANVNGNQEAAVAETVEDVEMTETVEEGEKGETIGDAFVCIDEIGGSEAGDMEVDKVQESGGEKEVPPVSKDGKTKEAPVTDINRKPEVGKIKFRVKDVSRVRNTVLSDPVTIQNMKWRIMLMPQYTENDGGRIVRNAGIFVQCDPEVEGSSWLCQGHGKITVKNKAHEDLSKKITEGIFTNEHSCWGHSSFIPWVDLLDNRKGFSQNDRVTIEAVVEVDPPLFFQSALVYSNKQSAQQTPQATSEHDAAKTGRKRKSSDKNNELLDLLTRKKEELTVKVERERSCATVKTVSATAVKQEKSY